VGVAGADHVGALVLLVGAEPGHDAARQAAQAEQDRGRGGELDADPGAVAEEEGAGRGVEVASLDPVGAVVAGVADQPPDHRGGVGLGGRRAQALGELAQLGVVGDGGRQRRQLGAAQGGEVPRPDAPVGDPAAGAVGERVVGVAADAQPPLVGVVRHAVEGLELAEGEQVAALVGEEGHFELHRARGHVDRRLGGATGSEPQLARGGQGGAAEEEDPRVSGQAHGRDALVGLVQAGVPLVEAELVGEADPPHLRRAGSLGRQVLLEGRGRGGAQGDRAGAREAPTERRREAGQGGDREHGQPA
jgi:hypothetical protein